MVKMSTLPHVEEDILEYCADTTVKSHTMGGMHIAEWQFPEGVTTEVRLKLAAWLICEGFRHLN